MVIGSKYNRLERDNVAQQTVKQEYKEGMRQHTALDVRVDLHRAPTSLAVVGGWKEKECEIVDLWSFPLAHTVRHTAAQASQEVSAVITTDPAASLTEAEP